MLSKEDITVTQIFLHRMFERTLYRGVQNMYTIEIHHVNENDVKLLVENNSKIKKFLELTPLTSP